MDVKPVTGEQIDKDIPIYIVEPHADVPDKANSIFVDKHIIFLSGLWPVPLFLTSIIYHFSAYKSIVIFTNFLKNTCAY